MSFANRINQVLHDEHAAVIALVQRLELVVARHRRAPPMRADPAVAQLLKDLAGAKAEVVRHFAFEEQRLFPYLDTRGDSAIGAHLTAEHAVLGPLWTRVAALARQMSAQGLDEEKWNAFCRLADELCEPMAAHAQKEDMALLPLIEESMDGETELHLYQEYAEAV
jgi:hemerythrin-like domain-containing protein